MSRLYFAAKAPVTGEVKTRLGATIGMEQAARLYTAFLRDLARRFANSPFEVAWHVAPGSEPHLRAIVGRGATLRVQRGDGWAARQANLFRDAEAAGEGAIVLAASDSPQLKRQTVVAAFAALRHADIVIGPTIDGGYYLIGMHRFHDIFSGIVMSTDVVLDHVIRRARAERLTHVVLDPEFDVDTEEDLARLAIEARRRRDLASTALALARLQAVEALA